MISITDKRNCCGCGACVQRCPKQCITLQTDSEGFLYPRVEISDCIDCGLCEKVCSIIHPHEERKPKAVFAAINKDEAVRMESSSGGIFTLLAEATIENGGVVFGARFDKEWQVTLDYTKTKEGLRAFRGSKYVQARTGTTFKECERFLKEGREVLFSGTPCQIASLKHFLGEEYTNLLTVDIVCHGTPSPKVWHRYLDEITEGNPHHIHKIEFRNKSYDGWKQYHFSIDYEVDGVIRNVHQQFYHNNYMRAFIQNLTLRPSCYECKAKSNQSHSDITLADFWGVEKHHSAMDDDKGTGLILVHSYKGQIAINISKKKSVTSTYEIAVSNNPMIEQSAVTHQHRDSFFRELNGSQSVIGLIEKELQLTFMQHIYKYINRTKRIVLHCVSFMDR